MAQSVQTSRKLERTWGQQELIQDRKRFFRGRVNAILDIGNRPLEAGEQIARWQTLRSLAEPLEYDAFASGQPQHDAEG
jgi:hypothetical protein